MKVLNKKAMTLVEVIAALALLSIVSLVLLGNSFFAIKVYEDGKNFYEKTASMANNIERGNAPQSAGEVSFKVRGTQVSVKGVYYRETINDKGRVYSLTAFKPY